jgi:hypothetical protein
LGSPWGFYKAYVDDIYRSSFPFGCMELILLIKYVAFTFCCLFSEKRDGTERKDGQI